MIINFIAKTKILRVGMGRVEYMCPRTLITHEYQCTRRSCFPLNKDQYKLSFLFSYSIIVAANNEATFKREIWKF